MLQIYWHVPLKSPVAKCLCCNDEAANVPHLNDSGEVISFTCFKPPFSSSYMPNTPVSIYNCLKKNHQKSSNK